MTRRLLQTAFLIAALVVLPACPTEFGGGVTDTGPQAPTAIQIVSGQAVTGAAGEPLGSPLTVRVVDAQTRVVAGATVNWTATGGTLGNASTTTDAMGQAQVGWTLSQTAGSYEAQASVPNVSPATFSATVTPGPVADITLSHESLTLPSVGASEQVTVSGVHDEYGNAHEEAAVTWSSANESVARVDATGLIQGVGAGTATVVAASGAAEGTVAVTVEASDGDQPIVGSFGSFNLVLSPGDRTAGIGEELQYTASVTDQDGAAIEGADVRWASSNPAVAEITAAGEVTTWTAGETRIAISYQGHGISALLTVQP